MNELEKMDEYIAILPKRVSELRWGFITIEIQGGVPVRIREEKTHKLDGDEETLWP